jgi:protein-L-isoaspartate(D-aspartate) O-methyltransferase
MGEAVAACMVLNAVGGYPSETIMCAHASMIDEGPDSRSREVDFERARHQLVETLRTQGIRDLRVLSALDRVPRHEFVPPRHAHEAYGNYALPIGHGQTISQPYIVALMTELLDTTTGDRILEVGTGSGYQTAVLAELGCDVYTVEIIGELADRASEVLSRLGYRGVHQLVGDGHLGWPEHAPFDGLIVTAAPTVVPEALVEQVDDGNLVAPVGAIDATQELLRLEKDGSGRLVRHAVAPVRFVPLVSPRPNNV